VELKDQSPFEAAALIQTSADGSHKPSVALKVKLRAIFTPRHSTRWSLMHDYVANLYVCIPSITQILVGLTLP